jgi:hypothetical protein
MQMSPPEASVSVRSQQQQQQQPNSRRYEQHRGLAHPCGRYHGFFSGSSVARRPGAASDVVQLPNSTSVVANAKSMARYQKLSSSLNSRLARDLADIEKSRREAVTRHRVEVERTWARFEKVRYAVSVPLDELQVTKITFL